MFCAHVCTCDNPLIRLGAFFLHLQKDLSDIPVILPYLLSVTTKQPAVVYLFQAKYVNCLHCLLLTAYTASKQYKYCSQNQIIHCLKALKKG